MLKQEYKEDETSLNDALDLSIKVLSKTLDMTKLTPEKIELATLTRENNKTQIKILPADKVLIMPFLFEHPFTVYISGPGADFQVREGRGWSRGRQKRKGEGLKVI